MTRKILVILAHPNLDSFCGSLFEQYVQGAEAGGYEVKSVALHDLSFDPILHKGYKEDQVLEEDLQQMQQNIRWAEHLVFIFPTWWSSFPALLKGFIDRVFLPGFSYKFHKGKIFPDKLLKGRTGRLIITMDAPEFIYRFALGAPGR